MPSTCDDLLKKVKTYNPDANLKLIKDAFEFASHVHRDQLRLSGDPYITHLLATAEILAELEQSEATLAAALLHDSVEDGKILIEDIQKKFGSEIAKLVEGVTKLGQLVYESHQQRQAENFRKMFLAMAEDIRIIIIKLSDRLHNMRTLEYLPPAKQKEISLETKDIFAPLAHRLGIWQIKWELEDLAFKYLEPQAADKLRDLISSSRKDREKYVKQFIEEVQNAIKNAYAEKIKAEISGRPKHFYSIAHKMAAQNLSFDEIFDLHAIRIIVDELKDCYAILGTIHAIWKPIPGKFKDYIAMPKPNGYQSLHTTVVGPEGKPVEIQIRTAEMHRIAEHGIAAHWRYKEKETDKKFDEKLSWLRQMVDWQSDLADARDFMETLKVDLFTDEVFVFSPKGTVLSLPVGATPIDFAYHIHTEVGHRCQGAKINGRIVPLNTKLKNGDIVEILTGKTNNPKLDWINFAKTSGARSKIKQWLKKEKRGENIERGYKLLCEKIIELGLNPKEILKPDALAPILKSYNASAPDDLFAFIGYGEVSAYKAAHSILELFPKKETPPEKEDIGSYILKRKPKGGQGVLVSGESGVMVRFSKCCNPLPGDPIVGFITKGAGISIHRRDCHNVLLLAARPTRKIKVEWDSSFESTYPVEIEVEAFDRVGLAKDILAQVSETGTNISSVDMKSKKGSHAVIKIAVDIKNINHLQQVMQAVRKVTDVYDVYRVRA